MLLSFLKVVNLDNESKREIETDRNSREKERERERELGYEVVLICATQL